MKQDIHMRVFIDPWFSVENSSAWIIHHPSLSRIRQPSRMRHALDNARKVALIAITVAIATATAIATVARATVFTATIAGAIFSIRRF